MANFVGTAFRLEQNNAANGTWIKICEDGIYYIAIIFDPSAASQSFAISKNANATQRSTSPGSFATPNGGLPLLVYDDSSISSNGVFFIMDRNS